MTINKIELSDKPFLGNGAGGGGEPSTPPPHTSPPHRWLPELAPCLADPQQSNLHSLLSWPEKKNTPVTLDESQMHCVK